MTNRRSLIFAVMVFLCCFVSSNAVAQDPLNRIRIDQCNPNPTPTPTAANPAPTPTEPFDSAALVKLIELERRRGLILDARRFAIDQATGKINFEGKIGRVSVVNMNPFVYRYEISVKQAELVSSAVSDFIDILLPPGLRAIGVSKSGASRSAVAGTAAGNIDKIWGRLNFQCTTGADCEALNTMKTEAGDIKTKLRENFAQITGALPDEVGTLTESINKLRDEQADAYTTCVQARAVQSSLASYHPADHVTALEKTQKDLNEVLSIAIDLGTLATEFTADEDLKNSKIRCGGFNCANQFAAYALAVKELVEKVYQPILNERLTTWRGFQSMLDLTKKMEGKEGLFARTFEIRKKFELSEATISVARTKPQPEKNDQPSGKRDASRQGDDSTDENPFNENDDTNGNGDNGNKKAADDKKDKDKDDKSETSTALAADINEPIRIGRPRFLVSGGLVYAPLARQSFVSATGFTRDAQGNPVGESNKKVISFEENSPRRLLPMVFLNSRLASFSPASIYFTLGVTAKHDKNIDVEYLLGPSVSMLNDRAMFTFGAYAGKSQRLVPDVKIGDEIPDSAGNASLTTKHYTWKPGFSFSYVFSNLSKRTDEAASGGSGGKSREAASAADELKDEIRIGGIPFNLAMGLAYTSLEDQSFDEILGFARDRQGNLTNGQTLTRIVGLSSSSNYRLVPLAMLHSRLLNFGRHSFYFTSGVTGRKDDDKIQIEYLLGGSVNVYKRKLFFTFGAFAGKQQELGGDLFLGGKLNPAQDVTVHSRYVWKPAFAFSYDISKILPAGSKK